jgi:hypothetical protein
VPRILRNHLTRRANQRHDAIIAARVIGGVLAKPIETGAIQPHAQFVGWAKRSVPTIHSVAGPMVGTLPLPTLLLPVNKRWRCLAQLNCSS